MNDAKQWSPIQDANLCDLIADGVSISAAGKMIGVSEKAALGRFRRIRESMGSQAQ